MNFNYKLVAIIPALLLVISASGLYMKMSTTGLERDVELKGGVQLSVSFAELPKQENIERVLSDYDVNVRISRGLTDSVVLITAPAEANATEMLSALEKNYKVTGHSIRQIGPVLGEMFFSQAKFALIGAFILMSVVVFIIFRDLLPSFYVVLSVFADIVESLFISQIIGVKLSFATFAALLLLIGYSVDTDILLTTRVLKSGSKIKESINKAMKTGLTMSVTTISAVTALLIMSSSQVLREITIIMLIGLIVDIINTWGFNAVLLRWHKERGGK